MTEPLDPLAADEVLRRAAEISARGQAVPADAGYDRRALTDAASEVGIERRAVELALAEHDAGILHHADARGGLLGASRVLETRVVDRSVTESNGHVTHWLRAQLLHRDERHGTAEVWRPRDDLGAKLRRKVDARTARRVRLGEVDAVEVSVVDCGEGKSLVRLEVVLDDMRRGLRTGVVVVPAAVAPVLGIAAAALTGEVAVAVGAVPLGGALGAVGTLAGRRTLADQRERARRALCSFLDGLEDA
jgi:hypothetical protein